MNDTIIDKLKAERRLTDELVAAAQDEGLSVGVDEIIEARAATDAAFRAADFCPHGVIPPDDCPTCRH